MHQLAEPRETGLTFTFSNVDNVVMLDFRDRFRVQSPKGPYVGYGVCDAASGGWLTEVDLPASEALAVAAALMVAAAPREVRRAKLIRPVLPPRAIRATSQAATLVAWAARSTGWVGFVLIDGEMQAGWVAADKLSSLGADDSEAPWVAADELQTE